MSKTVYKITDKPTATSYDDTALKARITALENKPDNDKQTLTFNAGNRNLSISNGNSVTLPNDNQTISKQGNKLILSNGGGEVELPVPNTSVPYDDTALKKRVSDLEARPDNDKQTLTIIHYQLVVVTQLLFLHKVSIGSMMEIFLVLLIQITLVLYKRLTLGILMVLK